MIVGLDHVQVAAPAGCEAQARRFYGDWLGLEEIEKPPVLAARVVPRRDERAPVGVTADFAPAAKAHPALRVGSRVALEHLAALLEAHGVSISRPDPDEVPGTARLHISDPWGNRVELLA